MKLTPFELERGRDFILGLGDRAKAIDEALVLKCRESAAAIRAEADSVPLSLMQSLASVLERGRGSHED